MVKYIVAGYHKTGTKSLAKAFRSLGYRVYDAGEMLEHFRDQWADFFSGTFI
jgi:methylmalonyl-CoA mutase cobalamin-binding subunit